MTGGKAKRLVFVCQHGAFRSRLAAAFFNSEKPEGWEAESAGVTPQSEVSTRLLPRLAGTTAAAFADVSDPRSLDPARADRVIAIDVPLVGAETWTTDAASDEALRDEIQRRIGLLLEEVGKRPAL